MKYESMKNENWKKKIKNQRIILSNFSVSKIIIKNFKNNNNKPSSRVYLIVIYIQIKKKKLPNTILAICLIGNFYFFFFRMKVHRNGNATDVIKSISQIDNSNKQC